MVLGRFRLFSGDDAVLNNPVHKDGPHLHKHHPSLGPLCALVLLEKLQYKKNVHSIKKFWSHIYSLLLFNK